MRAWMGWAALGVMLSACAESRAGDASALSACFEGRELEGYAEKHEEECTVEIDVSGDGTIDERTVNTFDEQGRLIEVRVNGGVKRAIDYDADGVVVRTWFGDDGMLQEETREEHDAAGNVLVVSTDGDGDGVLDLEEHHDYGCWDEEPARLWPGPCRVERDRGADGEVEVVETTTYDSADRPETVITEGTGGRSVTSYTYGTDGEFERIDVDAYDDGTVDSSSGVDFDDRRRPVREWTDSDADDEAEDMTEYAYDDEDRVVLEVWTWHGTVRRRETSYLDGGRRSVEVITDSRGPEDGAVYERRLDGAGNVLAIGTDNGSDGTIELCAYASYACWTE